MERFNALGRGAQLMLIGAVLLFIDLFFSWQSFDLPEPFGDVTRSGWYGFAGVVLGILTIILLAWLIVRIASVNIPVPVSTAMSAAVIGTLILIFAVIKLLTILGDEQTIWAWIGVALAVVVAVGAFQAVQEAGGVETLRSEASSMGSGSTTAPAAAAPTAPPPPAAPAEPAAPPPPAPEPEASAPEPEASAPQPEASAPEPEAGAEPSAERES